MTRQTIALWTCNACQGQINTAADKQPPGWRGYWFTASGVPSSSEPDATGHLCASCARQVVDRATTSPPTAKDPA